MLDVRVDDYDLASGNDFMGRAAVALSDLGDAFLRERKPVRLWLNLGAEKKEKEEKAVAAPSPSKPATPPAATTTADTGGKGKKKKKKGEEAASAPMAPPPLEDDDPEERGRIELILRWAHNPRLVPPALVLDDEKPRKDGVKARNRCSFC